MVQKFYVIPKCFSPIDVFLYDSISPQLFNYSLRGNGKII